MAKKINRRERDLDISSMIDVVFLLIMFFVVTTDLDRQDYDERVKLAECKFLKPEEKALPKSIVINILKDGRFTINRIIYSENELQNKLTEAKKKHGDLLSVIIRFDRDGFYKDTSKLKKIGQKLQLTKFRLVSQRK